MKISHKLPIAFVVVSLLVASAALFGFYQLNQSNNTYSTLIEVDVRNQQAIAAMLVDFKTQVQEWKDVLLRGKDQQQLDKHWASFEKHEKQVASAATSLQAALPAGDARTAVEQFIKAHVAMHDGYRKGLDVFKSSGFDPSVGDQAVKGIDRAPAELLNKAIKEINALVNVSVEKASARTRQAIFASLALMAVGLCAALVLSLLISRAIVRPLRKVIAVAKTVAQGDLGSTIVVETNDENGEMLQALKDMNDSLSRTVVQVRMTTDAIATASTQIATGNLDLSARTEEQARALEQTASSMEEQTAVVKLNAENARRANAMARSASDVATRGGRVVGNVVETMGAIDRSAKEIADIIGIIDGIAFQTNILALNAAVEAARAGEQGRGFAVVAGEVRTLAQRSAAAAKEIKALIDNSVQTVNEGTNLVAEAGLTMQQVVDSIGQVTEIMAEITNATSEQTQGIEHVNQAISQMDEVTQQNAALVEEAAAAADAMKDQAAHLADVVSMFKVGA